MQTDRVRLPGPRRDPVPRVERDHPRDPTNGGLPVQRETRYAKSGPVSIAYQVVGDGPIDLILVPGFVSHVEVAWEEPRLAHFLSRLASFSRLIVFDKRGTGHVRPGRRVPRRWTSGWTTSGR